MLFQEPLATVLVSRKRSQNRNHSGGARFWMTDHEHESERKRTGPKEPYPAQKARQGEIILRTRTRQIIFISGLVGFVILAVILRLAL
jgi:hypothetical protein